MKTVLIVDDHPAIRMAVRILLLAEGFHICGEVDNGIDALQIVRASMPDIVVLDIGIPKLDGIDVINRIKKSHSQSLIVVLSAQDGNHIMSRCFQAGADGFISKMDDLTLLCSAIRACLVGKRYFPDEIISEGNRISNVNSDDALLSLSDREMSVFLSLCKGCSNKEIANNMLLSEKTISTYKSRVMRKLQVNNMVELIGFAKRYMVI
ncbi:response regulator transcription factor [Aeromonas salmonicida]|uniref:response regulator transcription factor n=1 Tax=Aeromonas salmonicida TaxID=645 RepID=UPI001BA55F0E|nr:response regulator transcription factor [Aeromonas salmonicida]MBS2781049.1 response regulator transcription factor [Aeromonas salmonicida]